MDPINALTKIQEKLGERSFSGDSTSVSTQIDRIDKKIRHNLKPQMMEKYFLPNEW